MLSASETVKIVPTEIAGICLFRQPSGLTFGRRTFLMAVDVLPKKSVTHITPGSSYKSLRQNGIKFITMEMFRHNGMHCREGTSVTGSHLPLGLLPPSPPSHVFSVYNLQTPISISSIHFPPIRKNVHCRL